MLQVVCLIIVDLFAFYTSLFIAWLLRSEVMPYFVPDLPVLHFSYLSISFRSGGYRLFSSRFSLFESLYVHNLPFWDETRDIVKSVTHASITLLAIVTLGKMGDIMSRLVLLNLWVVSVFIFPVFRLWGKKFLYHIGIWRERILVIGAGNAGRLVIEGLQREKHMGYEVVGLLDDDKDKSRKNHLRQKSIRRR